jgi:arylsulfatase A-like enzyme
MKNRNTFLFLMLCTLSALAACNSSPPATMSAAPNVVIIIADDMGWADVGFHGSEIRTPAIDALAAEGVTLNRFYAHPVCSPTRGALMTGRSPLNTGILSPFEPYYERGVSTDEKYMPQYFKDAGYQTFAIGKWHLGPNLVSQHPQSRGFDHFYGHLNGFLNYRMHTIWRAVDWQRNGETVIEEGYTTHLSTNEAVHLIESRDPDKPMFLYVAFNAPHTPLQAPPDTINEYANIEDVNRRKYAAMVTELDRGVGKISAALEAEGIADNTLVMFMSDNGGAPSLGASNGSFRGGKGFPWEGGIRVPALIRWPGMLEAGTFYDGRVTIEDLLPTFTEAVGVPLDAPKPLDGQSVWPALAEGGEVVERDAVLGTYGRGKLQLAFFSGQWKLVQVSAPRQDLQFHLFDIRNDPNEESDLAAEYPEEFERLKAELNALPRVDPLALGEETPDQSQPGAPRSIDPDNRSVINPPYTETARSN